MTLKINCLYILSPNPGEFKLAQKIWRSGNAKTCPDEPFITAFSLVFQLLTRSVRHHARPRVLNAKCFSFCLNGSMMDCITCQGEVARYGSRKSKQMVETHQPHISRQMFCKARALDVEESSFRRI